MKEARMDEIEIALTEEELEAKKAALLWWWGQ